MVQSWFAQEVQLEADSLEVPTAAVALAEEPKAEQAAEEELRWEDEAVAREESRVGAAAEALSCAVPKHLSLWGPRVQTSCCSKSKKSKTARVETVCPGSSVPVGVVGDKLICQYLSCT